MSASLINEKKVVFFDLDDTLVNTHEATILGLRRAYKKLVSLSKEDLIKTLSFDDFKKELYGIYNTKKDNEGRPFFDYDAEVFEVFCNEGTGRKLNMRYKRHSLAAKLFLSFKETKNKALMADRHAFSAINKLKGLGIRVNCITKGKCNYQYTKLMSTDLEDVFSEIIVTANKSEDLKSYTEGKQNFEKKDFVIVGDSPSDMEAGEKAGMDTIRIITDKYKDKEHLGKENYSTLEEFSREISNTEEFKNITKEGKMGASNE